MRVDNGGELETSGEESRFDEALTLEFGELDGIGPNNENGKLEWWAAAVAAANRLLSEGSMCGNGWSIGDDASVFGVAERLWLVGFFEAFGRTTTGTTGVDEATVVETLVLVVVVAIADAVVVVFNGDVARRCESNRFNVSLVTVAVDVVVGGVELDEVKHGVFMTSRRICGIGVAFELLVTVEIEFVSTIDAVDSATAIGVGGVVATALFVVAVVVVELVNPPFATSSITSSICDRAGSACGVGCFSPFKFDEETMFETRVIKSVGWLVGVEILVVGVGADRNGWFVGLGNEATNE